MASFDDHASNLLFLFALAPLATACDDPDSTSTTTTPGTTTGTTTTGTMPGTTPGTTQDPDSGTTAPDTVGTTAGTTTNDPDSDSGTSTGGFDCEPKGKLPKVGEIDDVCTTYAEKFGECYGPGVPQECIDLYEIYCQASLDAYTMISDECVMAYMDYMNCWLPLSCEEIMDDTDDCPKEMMAFDMECGRMLNSVRPRDLRRR